MGQCQHSAVTFETFQVSSKCWEALCTPLGSAYFANSASQLCPAASERPRAKLQILDLLLQALLELPGCRSLPEACCPCKLKHWHFSCMLTEQHRKIVAGKSPYEAMLTPVPLRISQLQAMAEIPCYNRLDAEICAGD